MVKEILMTKEEKERIKQENLDRNRKDTISHRADFEIRKIISESLHKNNFSYSEIIVYDVYTQNKDQTFIGKTPSDTYYQVDFSADIISNPDIFTKRTDTITGYIRFHFSTDKENYDIHEYAWDVSKDSQIDFSDNVKNVAKFAYDQYTGNYFQHLCWH